MRTSITTVLLPVWSGSATASISSPSRPAAKTFSFSSIVVKLCPGGMLRKVAQAATVSPSAVQTPPWTKPPGCRWRLSTTMRPRAWVSSTSSGSMPRSPGKLPGRKARTLSGVIAEPGWGWSVMLAPRSNAESIEAMVAVGLVAVAHGLAEALFRGLADEGVPLLGVTGDAVEEGPEQLGLVQALRVERLVDEHLHHHELVERHPRHALHQA